MLRTRLIVLSLPLVALSPVVTLGAEPPALAVLKQKGLTRSGRLFVLDAEDAVLEKWKATRAVLADYNRIAERKNEAELSAREVAQLEERRVALQERLNDLNQHINEQGFQSNNNRPAGFGQGAYVSQLIAQRDMIRVNLAEVVSAQKSIKGDAGPAKEDLEAASRKSREAAVAALRELRERVDAVAKQYAELNDDPAVKKALRTLENDKVGTFKLGPTSSLKAAMKSLENAERTILAKRTTAVSRKKTRLKK